MSQTYTMPEVGDDDRLTPAHYLAVREDGLTFMQCAFAAIEEIDLVRNVDRLYGTNLLNRGTPIELMVDQACGRPDRDKETFLKFVWNCIFIRVERIKP